MIYVGFNFDGLKLEQALVKIGLNCLFHYYPETKSQQPMKELISYVMNGSPGITGGLETKDAIMDKDSRTHSVFFHQLADALKIRLSLFDGQFVFYFWMSGIQVLRDKEFSRMVIKFDERLNLFETQQAFLQSFIAKDKRSVT